MSSPARSPAHAVDRGSGHLDQRLYSAHNHIASESPTRLASLAAASHVLAASASASSQGSISNSGDNVANMQASEARFRAAAAAAAEQQRHAASLTHALEARTRAMEKLQIEVQQERTRNAQLNVECSDAVTERNTAIATMRALEEKIVSLTTSMESLMERATKAAREESDAVAIACEVRVTEAERKASLLANDLKTLHQDKSAADVELAARASVIARVRAEAEASNLRYEKLVERHAELKARVAEAEAKVATAEDVMGRSEAGATGSIAQRISKITTAVLQRTLELFSLDPSQAPLSAQGPPPSGKDKDDKMSLSDACSSPWAAWFALADQIYALASLETPLLDVSVLMRGVQQARTGIVVNGPTVKDTSMIWLLLQCLNVKHIATAFTAEPLLQIVKDLHRARPARQLEIRDSAIRGFITRVATMYGKDIAIKVYSKDTLDVVQNDLLQYKNWLKESDATGRLDRLANLEENFVSRLVFVSYLSDEPLVAQLIVKFLAKRFSDSTGSVVVPGPMQPLGLPFMQCLAIACRGQIIEKIESSFLHSTGDTHTPCSVACIESLARFCYLSPWTCDRTAHWIMTLSQTKSAAVLHSLLEIFNHRMGRLIRFNGKGADLLLELMGRVVSSPTLKEKDRAQILRAIEALIIKLVCFIPHSASFLRNDDEAKNFAQAATWLTQGTCRAVVLGLSKLCIDCPSEHIRVGAQRLISRIHTSRSAASKPLLWAPSTVQLCPPCVSALLPVQDTNSSSVTKEEVAAEIESEEHSRFVEVHTQGRTNASASVIMDVAYNALHRCGRSPLLFPCTIFEILIETNAPKLVSLSKVAQTLDRKGPKTLSDATYALVDYVLLLINDHGKEIESAGTLLAALVWEHTLIGFDTLIAALAWKLDDPVARQLCIHLLVTDAGFNERQNFVCKGAHQSQAGHHAMAPSPMIGTPGSVPMPVANSPSVMSPEAPMSVDAPLKMEAASPPDVDSGAGAGAAGQPDKEKEKANGGGNGSLAHGQGCAPAWLRPQLHTLNAEFHSQFPDPIGFSPTVGLPVYFGNVIVRSLPVFDVLIHRGLEVGDTKFVIQLCGAMQSIYAWHDEPATFVLNLFHYHDLNPALTPVVRASLLRLTQCVNDLMMPIPAYVRDVSVQGVVPEDFTTDLWDNTLQAALKQVVQQTLFPAAGRRWSMSRVPWKPPTPHPFGVLHEFINTSDATIAFATLSICALPLSPSTVCSRLLDMATKLVATPSTPLGLTIEGPSRIHAAGTILNHLPLSYLEGVPLWIANRLKSVSSTIVDVCGVKDDVGGEPGADALSEQGLALGLAASFFSRIQTLHLLPTVVSLIRPAASPRLVACIVTIVMPLVPKLQKFPMILRKVTDLMHLAVNDCVVAANGGTCAAGGSRPLTRAELLDLMLGQDAAAALSAAVDAMAAST